MNIIKSMNAALLNLPIGRFMKGGFILALLTGLTFSSCEKKEPGVTHENETVQFQGNTNQALGQATLKLTDVAFGAAPSLLSVSNIGGSGKDGVSMKGDRTTTAGMSISSETIAENGNIEFQTMNEDGTLETAVFSVKQNAENREYYAGSLAAEFLTVQGVLDGEVVYTAEVEQPRLLPVLLGFAVGAIAGGTIYHILDNCGYKTTTTTVTDAHGNPVLDANGNPTSTTSTTFGCGGIPSGTGEPDDNLEDFDFTFTLKNRMIDVVIDEIRVITETEENFGNIGALNVVASNVEEFTVVQQQQN